MRLALCFILLCLGSPARGVAPEGAVSPEGTGTPTAAAPDGAAVPVAIAGSRFMVPLLRRLADVYHARHPESTIEVHEEIGGTGLRSLIQGRVRAVGLARPIRADEIPRLRHGLGHDPVGTPIAMGAVLIVVHQDNPIDSLSVQQVAGLFSGRIRSWEDLGPFLERPELHVLDLTSDVREVFLARVLLDRIPARFAREHQDQAQLVAAVGQGMRAAGFCELGEYVGVRVVPIRSTIDDRPVSPDPQTIRNHTYPFAHYLYLYSAGQPKGQLKDFITFVLSAEGQRVVVEPGTGAVALPFRDPNR